MDYLIFALATRMCLSASNILRIRKGSVEIKDGVPYLLVAAAETSTRWPRYIPVPEDVCELLSAYIESSHSDQAGHIFFNEHGRPLRQRNLDDRVRKIIKNSGVKGSYTLKDLRSRGILELFNTASDNDTIAEYVGLGKERMEAFSTAAQFISKECPPDLVNYRLKVG